MICTATLLLLALFVVALGDNPTADCLSLQYMITTTEYWIVPYLAFVLSPSLIAFLLGRKLKAR
jgi:hypothetical protein